MLSNFSYIINLALFSFLARIILFYKTHTLCKVNSIGGIPYFGIKGSLHIGETGKVRFINNFRWSTLAVPRRCKLSVYKNAELIFKGKAGLSNAVIVATNKIVIGNNVMIGGGVTIIDSDFHSMDCNDWFTDNDALNAKSLPVIIEDNVFVGMNSIILKGVHIGERAVIAAGSVVTKNVPSGEVWGGNPARFIKKR